MSDKLIENKEGLLAVCTERERGVIDEREGIVCKQWWSLDGSHLDNDNESGLQVDKQTNPALATEDYWTRTL